MSEEKHLAQMTWREILHLVYDILSYPLFEIDGHPFSLGKLMAGAVLLVVGYMLSNRAAREVDRRLLARMNVDEALRYTLHRLFFYFFLFLATLFTLHMLAVPVTIFTVLGGALAVGIGFGSQNIVNNFISGVLVMVERPMRVGDFVEVDGVSGQVDNIGIRSTTIRTGAGAAVVMPNTTFIEKNLTNWTVAVNVSASIRFGVAYGTDVERLRGICLEAARGVPQILTTPMPYLNLNDFGDSALLFEFGYAIEAASVAARGSIASQLRLRLNELFKENRVDLPLPQRQVRILS